MASGGARSYYSGMTYQIEGAQGFKASATGAAEALTKARAAHRQFPPITIVGPTGLLTLAQLDQLAKDETPDA